MAASERLEVTVRMEQKVSHLFPFLSESLQNVGVRHLVEAALLSLGRPFALAFIALRQPLWPVVKGISKGLVNALEVLAAHKNPLERGRDSARAASQQLSGAEVNGQHTRGDGSPQRWASRWKSVGPL